MSGEDPAPPLTLQSALCPHSIFSSPVSSFSEEVMCSANPVCWLPPYSGEYANTSKPEILDLFTAQDNTLCISIWSARAEKGEWTTFFSFSSASKLWGDLKCRVFYPFPHISIGATLQRETHWLPSGESIQGDFYTYTEATAWNKSQNGGGRDDARGVQRAKLCVQWHEFKSWFIFFSLCSSLHLRFLIFSKEEGVLGRSHTRF